MRLLSPAIVMAFVLAQPGTAQEPAAPSYSSHAKLLVYRDAGGLEKPVASPQDWAIRRAHILKGMEAVMGPLTDRSKLPGFDVQTTERVEGDGFTRLSITLAVDEPGDRLPAYLFLPTGQKPGQRRAAILALHPTSPLGKGVVAGLGPRPNRGYGSELARRGYVVIAPDYPSFGDLAKHDFKNSRYVSGTMRAIVNHMRCVDLLQSRDDVDPERIGAIGHSLGGHNAMFVGAFDPRLKVIVSSCGWTPFHEYYGGKLAGWAQDRYMPRVRDVYEQNPDRMPFDFYEVVASLAPRAFFSNSPLKDSNFDVEGVRKGVAEAEKVYRLLGAAEALQVRYPDSPHDFPPDVRLEAYRFVDRMLKHTPTRETF